MHKSRGVGGGETHTLSRCEKTRAAKTSTACAFGRRPAHTNASSHLRAPRPAGACRLFDVEGGAAPPTAAAGSRHAPHRASGTDIGMPTGNGAERAGRGHDTTNRATQTSALPTLAANGRLHARSVRWAQVVAPATVAAAATAVGAAAPGEALSIPTLRSTPRCGRGSPAAIVREAAGAPKVDGRSNEVCNWRAASSRVQRGGHSLSASRAVPQGRHRDAALLAQVASEAARSGVWMAHRGRRPGPQRRPAVSACIVSGRDKNKAEGLGCVSEGEGERGGEGKSSTPYGGDGKDGGRGGGDVAQREQSTTATRRPVFQQCGNCL